MQLLPTRAGLEGDLAAAWASVAADEPFSAAAAAAGKLRKSAADTAKALRKAGDKDAVDGVERVRVPRNLGLPLKNAVVTLNSTVIGTNTGKERLATQRAVWSSIGVNKTRTNKTSGVTVSETVTVPVPVPVSVPVPVPEAVRPVVVIPNAGSV